MTEKLLHFIWRCGYFNQADLVAGSGESLQIVFPGNHNQHQGPDFLNARIRIGKTLLVGHVEMHLRSSDWIRHGHTADRNYSSVVLHVVVENDLPQTVDGIPTLALGDRIPRMLLNRYEDWMQSLMPIACAGVIRSVPELVWSFWKQRLLVERLLLRADKIVGAIQRGETHWEELCWHMLAGNMGVRVNTKAFESMAKSIPLNLLHRHRDNPLQLEAILLGQAGLLDKKFRDPFPVMLQREFRFLRKKYDLRPVYEPVHFLRMRPGNFPTLRLSQLAALLAKTSSLFSVVKEADNLDQLRQWLLVESSAYWSRHYVPDVESPYQVKSLGWQMVDNLLINTVVPILFAFGQYHGQESLKLRALDWMEKIPAEDNHLLADWKKLGIKICHAADSQGLIELRRSYCEPRRCLDCAIGNAILKQCGRAVPVT